MAEKNSLLGYLLGTAEENAKVFCREMNDDRSIDEYTFNDIIHNSSNLGKYLKDGQEWGNYLPLFINTSYNFLRTFFGIIAGKKICVPLHTISNDESIDFILKKIDAKCIFVTEDWLYKKLTQIEFVRTNIHTIFTTPEIIKNKSLPCQHVNLYEIFEQENEDAMRYLEERIDETAADDPMQLVFTSGTTGEPKGAILSHKNVISCVVRAGDHLNIDSTYRTLTFLPLSHVMAQNEVFIALVKKAIVQIVGRDNLLHGMKTFKPNILVAVPRVYQAVYNGIQRKLRSKKKIRNLLNYIVNVYKTSKYSKSFTKRILAKLFTNTFARIITSKIKKNIGNFKLLVTAGAACPPHIYDFYEAINLPLTNAQGLTEVSGAIIYNQANETLRGSIGVPLKGVEVKVDDDDEILLRGDPVFAGYYKEPELNTRTFTSDGWFKSGDLGNIEMIKGKPYVFLKGRKKDILVLSSGLNIPAIQIEDRLEEHEIIHQAMVIGDGEPRVSALIVPNDDQYNNPNLRNEISKIIRQVNAQMDASEHIGKFEILPEPFTVENGMLTPTLKIRRPVIFQRYQEIIGRMYQLSAS